MEKFKFDVVSQSLVITARFAEAMNNPQSAEYKLVSQFNKDFPNLTITRKTHKSANGYITEDGERFSCNQFKNLTYKNMEAFMDGLPQAEAYRKEYDFLKSCAATIQHNGYTLVRKWFVKQFPAFRKNPLFYIYNTPSVVSSAELLAEMDAEHNPIAKAG